MAMPMRSWLMVRTRVWMVGSLAPAQLALSTVLRWTSERRSAVIFCQVQRGIMAQLMYVHSTYTIYCFLCSNHIIPANKSIHAPSSHTRHPRASQHRNDVGALLLSLRGPEYSPISESRSCYPRGGEVQRHEGGEKPVVGRLETVYFRTCNSCAARTGHFDTTNSTAFPLPHAFSLTAPLSVLTLPLDIPQRSLVSHYLRYPLQSPCVHLHLFAPRTGT